MFTKLHFPVSALVFLFVAFSGFMLLLSFLPVSSYAGLLAEDGPVETLTAVLCFLGAYFSVKIFSSRKKISGTKNLLPLLIGALFFFVGGEEISWGQRLLGFGYFFIDPATNVQREFNIHNLESLDFYIYFGGFLFIVLSTGILPLLSYFSKKIKRLCVKSGVPLMPPVICALLWLGFTVFVFIPQIRYGRGQIITIYYDDIYAIEELREFYFSLMLFSYIFVEYLNLLKYGKPYDFSVTSGAVTKEPLPSLSMTVFRDNAGTIFIVAFLALFLSPRIELIRNYRGHADQQLFCTDPDVIVLEGETMSSSDVSPWTNKKDGLFGGKYLSYYADTIPEKGYFSIGCDFEVNKAGSYRVYMAGAPAGSRQDTPFRHKFHSPYLVLIDQRPVRELYLEGTDEFLDDTPKKYKFYLHYEYSKDFHITRIGEFYLEKGRHRVEFRISEAAVLTGTYNFYIDAVVLTPSDWEPKKTMRSFPSDIFSH